MKETRIALGNSLSGAWFTKYIETIESNNYRSLSEYECEFVKTMKEKLELFPNSLFVTRKQFNYMKQLAEAVIQ